jgi:hypothetical protein
MNWYCIKAYVKNKANPLGGFRRYATDDYNKVYQIVRAGLLKYYSNTDILKIDVWPVTESNQDLQEYLKSKALTTDKIP